MSQEKMNNNTNEMSNTCQNIGRKNSRLDISTALCYLKPRVHLFVYENDGLLYVDLKKHVYEELLKNEDVEKHLLYGINEVIFCSITKPKELEVKEERLNLKTFLSACKSIKCVNVREFSFSEHQEENLHTLFQDLAVCRQIESFVGDYDCSTWLGKYILGIDLQGVKNMKTRIGDAKRKLYAAGTYQERLVHMEWIVTEVKRVAASWETLWPKVKSIEGFYYPFTVDDALPFFILTNLKCFNSKDLICPVNSKSIFFRDPEVFNNLTKKRFEKRIENVTIKELEFCVNNNLLTDKINFIIEKSTDIEDLNKLNVLFTQNRFLCNLISCLKVDLCFNDAKFINTVIFLVTKASKMKLLKLTPNNVDYPYPCGDILRSCGVVIDTLIVDYEYCHNFSFNNVNLFIFRRFSFIKHLKMVIYPYNVKRPFHKNYLRSLLNLKILKSVHVSIVDQDFVENNLINFMEDLSKEVQKGIKLKYLMNWESNSRLRSNLRMNGWIAAV